MDDALKAATHPHDFKLLVSSDGQRHTSVESVFGGELEEDGDEAASANGAEPAISGSGGAGGPASPAA
jgi:hypothetical protein